jgi:CheY-like chemotaxis protein
LTEREYMKDKRILLVDDNKNLLITVGDYLSFSGFVVETAKSGEEALKKLERFQPDLIILDISMPGMGGIGFLKRISDDDDRPKYPVLVLTARSAMEEFFSNIAVDGFLCKPCSEDKLVQRIREILTKQRVEHTQSIRSSKSILLGEDDERIAIDIQRVFAEQGYEIEVITNGPDILERAPGSMPDAILVKEILPRMNGGVVASLVGTMASTRSIPVILYDETRTTEEQQKYGVRVPPGVRKFLTTSRATDLLRAVQEAISS